MADLWTYKGRGGVRVHYNITKLEKDLYFMIPQRRWKRRIFSSPETYSGLAYKPYDVNTLKYI